MIMKTPKTPIIETDYFAFQQPIHQKLLEYANKKGISVDYFILEFCNLNDDTIRILE